MEQSREENEVAKDAPIETSSLANNHAALEAAKRTGIQIISENDDVIVWTGNRGGNRKPLGPLKDKTIKIIVASEFSDFQIYYLASFIGERGGICEFLMVDWVTWKFTRPNLPNKGIRGMWDLSVDPIPVMGASDKAARWKGLRDANPNEYDAIVIVGGHSADVMVSEPDVVNFIQSAAANGAILGSIGEGSMPLIAAGVMHGKKCTGNPLVEYMLKKIADFHMISVVTDGKLITAHDTVDTPAFLQALCRAFDPKFEDVWKDSLAGKTIMFVVGEDYEDIELIVPTMELLYRGAEILIGTFEPQFTSRSPHLGSNFAVGNFGTTIPFQEIPRTYYSIKHLKDVQMNDFDMVIISGGFNPWNIVATGATKWLTMAHNAGKPIAAICHGPIALAAADLINGKKLTGWLASKDSVEIMGGDFRPDHAAVIDGQFVSGRTPPELPEFIDAISVKLLDQNIQDQ